MLPMSMMREPCDADSALILPLVMLLMLDTTDMMTVFALMFILM